MLPLLYGYARVGISELPIVELESRMRIFAVRKGFQLAAVFQEIEGVDEALTELLRELRRADCLDVIVPTLEHLAGPHSCAPSTEARLHAETGARVWALDRH